MLLTPAQWEDKTGIRVLDPDGWRIDGKSFDEPIDEEEWERRMIRSTVNLQNWKDRNKNN